MQQLTGVAAPSHGAAARGTDTNGGSGRLRVGPLSQPTSWVRVNAACRQAVERVGRVFTDAGHDVVASGPVALDDASYLDAHVELLGADVAAQLRALDGRAGPRWAGDPPRRRRQPAPPRRPRWRVRTARPHGAGASRRARAGGCGHSRGSSCVGDGSDGGRAGCGASDGGHDPTDATRRGRRDRRARRRPTRVRCGRCRRQRSARRLLSCRSRRPCSPPSSMTTPHETPSSPRMSLKTLDILISPGT